MKRFAIILLILAGCSQPEAEPEGLLDRAKFKEVMLEAQLIEARVNHEMVIDRRTDSPVQQYYDSLFAQQNVTEEQFKKTFQYYAERPEELKVIYEEILTELTQRQDTVR